MYSLVNLLNCQNNLAEDFNFELWSYVGWSFNCQDIEIDQAVDRVN